MDWDAVSKLPEIHSDVIGCRILVGRSPKAVLEKVFDDHRSASRHISLVLLIYDASWDWVQAAPPFLFAQDGQVLWLPPEAADLGSALSDSLLR